MTIPTTLMRLCIEEYFKAKPKHLPRLTYLQNLSLPIVNSLCVFKTVSQRSTYYPSQIRLRNYSVV